MSDSTNGRPEGTTSWQGSVTELGSEMRSYYGRPVIKEPVWKAEIPWYLFTGGLGGASSVLGLLARRRGNDRLADAALFISLAADTASPLLLISDLGRPERFHHMLRMFKVTSPMNVGSWILAFSGTASGVAAGAHLLGLRRLRNAAEHVSGALGMPLASYTGVLLADTAIPAWHEARFELPLVFASSGAASAGAAVAIAVPDAAGPARRIAVAGALAQNVSMQVMQHRLGMLGEPYKRGAAGRFDKLARGLSLTGAAVLALAGRRRAAIGGVCCSRARPACAGRSSRPASSRRATRATRSSPSASGRTARADTPPARRGARTWLPRAAREARPRARNGPGTR